VKVAALVALTSFGLLAAGCGQSTTASGTTTTTSDKNGPKTMQFALTDAGCEPNTAETTSGLVTFEVENKGAAGVTELEVIKDKRILGEVENLADGLNGTFSLTLQPGDYELYCPNGSTKERGTLTVTGATVANDDNAAARKAIAAYKAYVIGQAGILGPRTTAFTDAVRAGDVAKAKKLFPTAREPYERIEPVAESFGDLDPQIDARAGDVPAATWTGFHKLEKMLWVDNSTAAEMKPFADKLDRDTAKLIALVKTADYQTAQIANGAKSLMDEIGASKVTGEEDRYSHTDLWDFQANVEGAKAAIVAVTPILAKGDPELLSEIRQRFTEVDQSLDPYREGSGYVLYTKLNDADTKKLSESIDALAQPISEVAPAVLR